MFDYIERKKSFLVNLGKYISHEIVTEFNSETGSRIRTVEELNNLNRLELAKNFTQRRKTLINVLVNSGVVKNKEIAMKIFDELEFDYGVRGETLNLEQYKLLIDCINKYSQY